jgi:hypothetical protein
MSAPAATPVAKRSRKLVVGSIVGALALGAGGLAVAVNSGSDGAGSPEQAVQQLLDSASASDLVGVMDSLAPGERETFRQPMLDTIKELKRLDILAKEADPTKVDALTMTFSDVTYATSEISSNIATVTMPTGSMTAKGDAGKLPFGQLVIDLAGPDGLPDGVDDETTDMAGSKITAVKVDGSWHVSLWYTIAERARVDEGAPAPSDATKVASTGSDSPEAAVADMVDALVDLAPRRVVELLPPTEYAVLKDYGYLFLDDLEAARADVPEYTLDIDLPVAVSGSGDRRTARPTGFTVKAVVDGESVEATYNTETECIDLKVNGEDPFAKPDSSEGGDVFGDSGLFGAENLCLGGETTEDALDALSPEMRDFTQKMEAMIDRSKVDEIGITVVRDGGKWYVTPVGTLTDAMVTMMEAVKAPELRALAEEIKEEGVENYALGLFGLSSLLGGDSFGGLPFGTEDSSQTDEWYEDGFDLDSPDDAFPEFPEVDPNDPFSRCFDIDDFSGSDANRQAVSDCFLGAVEAGEMEMTEVPLSYRYPECFARENELYSLTDVAELKALLAEMEACLQPLVDTGEVSEFELDPLMTNPECITDFNPYDYSADISEVDRDAVWECVYGYDVTEEVPADTSGS